MKDEIRQIITDQINRHVAMTDTHRAWLANDIATRVEAQVDRLLKIESEEHEARAAIQHHINRAELPEKVDVTDNQPDMVGKIIDELHEAQAALQRMADAECDREGPKVDDTARLNWIEHMAAECEGHILTRLFLPDGKPFRAKVDAAMELNPA